MASNVDRNELTTVAFAQATVLAQCSPVSTEPVALEHALGRYLAGPLLASLDLPPFTNSAMDGFAVRAADTPGRLRIIGEAAAGVPFGRPVGKGEAVEISTGGALPDGADAVAVIEKVTVTTGPGGAAEVWLQSPVKPGENIRRAGDDTVRGSVVLSAGTRLGAAQIGAAAALGVSTLQCTRRPTVAVLTTGTELREPGEQLKPGQIYNSNAALLRALAVGAGAQVIVIPSARDTFEQHRRALTQALEHDVAISTGGVSVGGHDLVREVLAQLGVRELFWRVKIKPGKPLSFGVTPDGKPPKLVFGVPGNPVSTLVGFEMFIRPAIAALQGAREPGPHFTRVQLAEAVRADPARDQLIRVSVQSDGRIKALAGQQSHQLASSAGADGLAWIPAGADGLAAGATVRYLPLARC
ncbi:MAG: gephyrin-like molybdotransferase Glp [Solirubrobacteraceae bacterium]